MTFHAQAKAAWEMMARPKRLRGAILAHSELLMPGKYLPADLATLAVHEGAAGSNDHLNQTVRGMSARLVENGLLSQPYGAVGPLVELATDLVVKAMAGRLVVTSSIGSATALKLAAEGTVIVIDPSGGQVIRIAPDPRYGGPYQQLRDRFAACVPAPEYRVTNGDRRLVEAYIPGTSFSVADPATREIVISSVLKHLRALVSLEVGASGAHVEGEILIASHGDLVIENIILHGSEYTAIDLASIKTRPYWYDTTTFLATADPEGLTSGRYHDALGMLQEVAGDAGVLLQDRWQGALLKGRTYRLPPGACRAIARQVSR